MANIVIALLLLAGVLYAIKSVKKKGTCGCNCGCSDKLEKR